MNLLPFYFSSKKLAFDTNAAAIEKYRNIHQGNRCFIIGTGPSLALSDIELIRNEITVGMNSIVKLFDKTSWRPTYYFIQDIFAYDALAPLEKWFKGSETKLFLGQLCNTRQEDQKYQRFIHRPYHDSWQRLFNGPPFSEQCERYVYDGRTIAYTAMQFAAFMGIEEIYLLGVDCNYQKRKDNHMSGLSLSHDNAAFIADSHDVQLNAMLLTYAKAEAWSREHGFRIFNASRGGNLDIFERVKLEDILKD